MITENLQNDAYMTTEHRRDKKAKVSFAMVMNKVLVGALILTSVAGGATVPVQAATTYEPSTTITENYKLNIENSLFNINQVTNAIKVMQAQGIVTNEILINLATELLNLSSAVISSGASASSEVIKAVANAETVVNTVTKSSENTDGLIKVNASITTVKSTLGIVTKEQTISNVSTLAVKAAYPTSFKDITKSSDYYTAVSKIAKLGAIGGYKDGTFKAKTNITNAKFICILMRSVNSKVSRATKGTDYTASVVTSAIKAGIVKSTELLPDDYSATLTKDDMALWTARAIEYKASGKNTKQLNNVENLISDFSNIDGSKYQDAVKDLYSLGILSGSNFKADSKVTRGTAVNVILKAVYSSYRKDMSKVKIPSTSTEARDSKILKWNDPSRGLAKIGDTWVDKNGKKTVLKGITWNGTSVPGYGTGIDLYSNMVSDGGTVLKVNNDGKGENAGWYNGDTTFMGQALLSAKSHNGVRFTYFRDQWLAISEIEQKVADKVKNPKDGDYAAGTHFMKYFEGEGWCWVGPVF